MHIRLILSTFVTVFFAELGDKTQLFTLSVALGEPNYRFSIFIAAAVGLVCSAALSVFAADFIDAYVPMKWLHNIAGVIMIVMGVKMLVDANS